MDCLDPLLLKAIKLLHSSSRSSTDQLKCMLDEALAQRKVSVKPPVRVSVTILPVNKADVNNVVSRDLQSIVFQIENRPKSEPAKLLTEKRPFEKTKVKTEASEVPEKRVKLLPDDVTAGSRSRSLTSSPEPGSRPLVVKSVEAVTRPEQEDSEATDIEEDGGEDESYPLEGMGEFDDLVCVICKTMETKPGNQLVECQECHSLYHQSCHKPPATDPDVLDPRTIWNCSKCTKNMKKSSVKQGKSGAWTKPSAPTASSAFQVAINIGKESALQLVKERSLKQQQQQQQQLQSPETSPAAASAPSQPFRRYEASKTTASPGAGAAKPIGLAGLAANLNNRTTTATTSAPASASSGTSAASTVTAAADRRLQMMKKKAARANEKKRSGSK